MESTADISVPSEESEGREKARRMRCVSISMHSAAGHSRPTIGMQLTDSDAIRRTESQLLAT